MDLLHSKITYIEQTVRNNEHDSHISLAVAILNEHALQYEIDTETLTNAVIFASQGSIHPRFMPAKLIKDSALLVKNSI